MRNVLYFFGLLTDGDVDWLARSGTRRRIAKGEILVEEGRATRYLILLLEGTLLIESRRAGPLGTARPGEILGEMSLVDFAPPSATITAREEGAALFVDKSVLLKKLKEDESFASRVYHAIAVTLADRLREHHDRGGSTSLSEDVVSVDELDTGVLDNLAAAGDRFRRMLADAGPAGVSR